jgi:hypothetical protein
MTFQNTRSGATRGLTAQTFAAHGDVQAHGHWRCMQRRPSHARLPLQILGSFQQLKLSHNNLLPVLVVPLHDQVGAYNFSNRSAKAAHKLQNETRKHSLSDQTKLSQNNRNHLGTNRTS